MASAFVRQMPHPLCLGEADAIEVELVCLVNQLQQPLVGGVLAGVECHPAVQTPDKFAAIGSFRSLMESFPRLDACLAQGVLKVHGGFAEEIAKLFEQR
jgi:hypothetical protein